VRFQEPIFLLALVLVPLAALAYRGSERRRRRSAAAFASPRTMPSAVPARPGWRRHVAPLAYGVALAVLALALARPQATIAVPDKRAAIMLVTDVSGSMRESDVQPTRLGAARRAAREFLNDVPEEVRVGGVAFNQTVRRAEAPTTARAPVRQMLEELEPGGGTAVGEGLAAGLRLVRAGQRRGEKPPPAAILLLTDGSSGTGRDPVDAAREAARAQVPVYTVALGSSGVDRETLSRVADLTKGRSYSAGDENRLRDVYRELGERVGRRKERREVTAAFAGGAALLLLVGGAASLLWFGRLP
jgi:Ca-activated chloride channel family protein